MKKIETTTFDLLKQKIGERFILKDISFERYKAFTFEVNDLVVGIFNYNYPNKTYAGKILMEFKDLFDKWSKCFYEYTLPEKEGHLKIFYEDLDYFGTIKSKHFSDNFGSICRNF